MSNDHLWQKPIKPYNLYAWPVGSYSACLVLLSTKEKVLAKEKLLGSG